MNARQATAALVVLADGWPGSSLGRSRLRAVVADATEVSAVSSACALIEHRLCLYCVGRQVSCEADKLGGA